MCKNIYIYTDSRLVKFLYKTFDKENTSTCKCIKVSYSEPNGYQTNYMYS